MNKEEIKQNGGQKKTLSWFSRFFFALFTAPGLGIFFAYLLTLDASKFESMKGFAIMYLAILITLFLFVVLLFISHLKTKYVIAFISTLGWLVVVMLMG